MKDVEFLDTLELLGIADDEIRKGDWIRFNSVGEFWTGRTRVGDIGIFKHSNTDGGATIILNAYTEETIHVYSTSYDQVRDHIEKIYQHVHWYTKLYYYFRRIFVPVYARFI
jgi:hypothetical protein